MVFASGSGQSAMVDMNITPLVDVMLVLLVIFMVTVPAVSYSNSLNLPQRAPVTLQEQNNEIIRLHLSAGGVVEWNGTALSLESLERRLGDAARAGIGADGSFDPMRQPRISIDADPAAEYDLLSKVLARTSNAHLERVGFAESGN